jgi:penicillin amidase
VFFGHIGKAADDYWGLRPRVIAAVLISHPEWCGAPVERPLPNPPAHAGEGRVGASCDALLAATLQRALAELRRAYGSDMAQWRWSRAHVAEFRSPVFSRIAVLRDRIDLAIAKDGGFDTVNVGSTTIADDAHPYTQIFGAGLRIITDLASPKDSRMIATPGQSGNPLSPHFSDLLLRWRDFDYLVPGRASVVTTLTLDPAR